MKPPLVTLKTLRNLNLFDFFMSYKAFALQYRPQVFDDVIGQGHVVNALKTAISTNRIHHAYIFSGPRGVGKTSLARIFAKSLNCEKGSTVTPCGVCHNCVDITKGTSMDVLEIDGASNRGIDEIRELREGVNLSTVSARFKIYIIDEVHMLTTEAFNALLKTLEEPPQHVKFIFATTHPHKVIPTILSRCQRFQLNLLPVESIAQKLKKIIQAEKVDIDDSLLYSIARTAGGSIRDAESLLDQLVPMVGQKENAQDILSFLGVFEDAALNKMIEALMNGDINICLGEVDRLSKEGKDLGVFLGGLIEQVRNILLAKASLKAFSASSDIPQVSREIFVKLSNGTTINKLLHIIDALLYAKEMSSKLNSVRIPFELALIRLICADTDAPRVNVTVKSPSPQKIEATVKKNSSLRVELEDEVIMEIDNLRLGNQADLSSHTSKINTAEEELTEDGIMLAQLKPRWLESIAKLQKVRAALAAHLSFAKLVSSAGPMVNIGFLKKDSFHKELIEQEKNRLFLEQFISDLLGKKVAIKFVLVEGAAGNVNPAPQVNVIRPQEKNSMIDDGGEDSDDFVNEILDAFNGKLSTDK
jgi:DNA polymerase-3 subunit gamma/tau